MQYEILRGDCVEQMRALPDASFDAIVTDPPYELGFMGKSWDASGIAYSAAMWAEALRVLKPGGHLLAFSGSRTYHRMTCAIEDAGFDIRDQIMWVYGSGFPKSMDVSKAIDKARDDRDDILAVTVFLADAADLVGIARADVDAAMGTSDMGGWWLSRLRHRCQCPKWEQWLQLKVLLSLSDEMDAEVWRLNGRKGTPGEAWGEREFFDTPTGGLHGGTGNTVGNFTGRQAKPGGVTDAARQWEGWGTALKPAHEPICVARKSLAKGATVAANVLQHGTGAINIDGCRVPAPDGVPSVPRGAFAGSNNNMKMAGRNGTASEPSDAGRWPANIIHDGSHEVVACFPGEENNSAARFFMECKGGYNDVCPNLNPPPSDALTAALNSPRPSQAVVSVLAHAASSALPAELLCSGLSPEPSTTATATDLRLLCESVTQAIQSIERKFWLESRPAKLTLTFNLASAAVHLEPTGTTTITISHWRSDGSAEPVTFDITRPSSAAGAKGSAPSTENSRLIYCAKASKSDRGPNNTHPTVKPLALMQYLCRLVTPPGGRILDPFAGSGSTIVAALREGFTATGIELLDDHAAIIEGRLDEELYGDII